jgi:hypothetical protein
MAEAGGGGRVRDHLTPRQRKWLAAVQASLERDASARLEAAKKEAWSERLKSKLALAAPADVDGELAELLRGSWALS